uniref:Uncharacterized protein n=1 Tax=Romanomermis culicivorax TaxID=13658 RepID=A0A915I0A6_ROMCU
MQIGRFCHYKTTNGTTPFSANCQAYPPMSFYEDFRDVPPDHYPNIIDDNITSSSLLTADEAVGRVSMQISVDRNCVDFGYFLATLR